MNSASCISIYFKNCGFKALFNPQDVQICFAGTLPVLSLALTPGARNANHEPSNWASISLRCQQMSVHIQLVQFGSKRNPVTQDITWEKNVPYSVLKIYFFPITRYTWLSSRNRNRYRIIICKISESNRQKITSVLSIDTTSRSKYIGVLSFRLLWLSLYGPRTMWGWPEVPCCL